MKLNEVQGKLKFLLGLADKNLPVRISYAIAKNIKLLNKECGEMEEQRIKLCEKYAKKDENGKAVIIENGDDSAYDIVQENKQQLQEEYKELLFADADLELHMVDMQEFEKCDCSDRYDVLTVAEYAALDFMIK